MLPTGFRFSQSNLQNYADCARLFQLRYVEGRAWPAVQVEPLLEHERHLGRGRQFHRLIERHQLGMEPDLLERGLTDPDLRAWWHAYLGFTELHAQPGERYPELALTTDLRASRIMAMFDLLLVVPGERAVIYDWKTYRRKPPRQWLAERLQTRVYPYVLARAGGGVFGGELVPEQISLVYWVASEPDAPEVFDYSSAQMQADEAYLAQLIDAVTSRDPGSTWPLTFDEKRCRFCEYRSLCDRGEEAGQADDFADYDGGLLELGLEDVEEIGF
ncbi:MAG: PD-(D/E)XK nuclease family protein [Chloroflexi bacterium]|nr:PD-(D/E)XK nuclease family protein [Chloroflexota bacterium]